jgi:hypothetical protein
MANSKISQLTELTSPANDDVLAIVDDSASETKKISFANLTSGITVGSATELQFTAINNTGSTITKGSAVYVSGHTTETQVADADNTSASTMPAFGIAKDDIANGATGTIVISGEISGVDMSAFSVGDELYVGTGGALTATKPTGTALIQKIGKVTKAAASGELLVIGAGRTNDLPNLPDGNIWIGDSSGVPQDKTLTAGSGITITEDATTVEIAATGGGGGATDLNGLTDVTITGTPGNGELLIAETSGTFVNTTLTAASDGFLRITNASGQVTLGAGQGTEVQYTIQSAAVAVAGEVEGNVLTFGTTTGMTAGAVYVWNGTDWVAVDADAEATTKGLMGVALGASSATDGLLTHGVAYLSHDPGTAGDILYVDTVTPGYLTSTQPSATGDFVRVAGYCLADNKVFFSPSQDWIEIA